MFDFLFNNNDSESDISNNELEINRFDEINDYFKLPIYYNTDKKELKQNIINDLELISTIDNSCNPIYNYVFDNNNDLSTKILSQFSSYYTTDTYFLKDYQKLLKNYKKIDKYTSYSNNYHKINECWNEIKNDNGFKEKYYYLDWPMWEFLNKSEHFLQISSIYNISSPLISLFIPILILIVPFFIVKLKGLNLTINEYIDVLKILASQHAIGKLFTHFTEVSMNEKIYLLISAAFYCFSIYQNILICIRFNSNMIKIHNYLKEIKIYLDYTIDNMDNYLIYSKQLSSNSHIEFNQLLIEKLNKLKFLRQQILYISDYKLTFTKIFEIGYVLKYFYELYDDKIINDAFMYSFGFNAYIDCIEGLQNNIDENKITFCKFTKKIKKCKIKNNYYAILKNNNKNCIKNNISLNKNIIITGPNASGKTTTIKSTLINIILSQQFGCGFYSNASICPYDFIHCYLNIPDTSGRDSLFQAEARRCKEIIDLVDNNKKSKHFCVFDELFSGTNPDEAIISANAFMEYLIKNKNISCILTTHFIKVCKYLDKFKNVQNVHMITNIDDKNKKKLIYTYKIKEGISEIKGGLNVLYNMDYPEEIIKNSQKNFIQ